MVNRNRLEDELAKIDDPAALVGQVLVRNGCLTSAELLSTLQLVQMMRDNGLPRDDAANALKTVRERSICVEQALFEKGRFRSPPLGSLRLSELLRMAGFITDVKLAECLELELFHGKSFATAVEERCNPSKHLLDSAKTIQAAVAAGELWPYQAVEALKKAASSREHVDDIIDSILSSRQQLEAVRISELLVEAQIVARDAIEKALAAGEESNVRLGKLLMEAGAIAKSMLHRALRCHSLLKYGVISKSQAVCLLNLCKQDNLSLDQALSNLGLSVPSRMQWSWV